LARRNKQGIKRLRQSQRLHVSNMSMKSGLKTAVTKARMAESDSAVELARQAGGLLDKAAGKGVIHKRSAARRKSRLAKAVAAKSAA